MDLINLRSFLAVVETGSFQTAAKLLCLSRATLRRRVDELEARAGIPLLDRTRLGAVPTEAGRVLAERGRFIVQEAGVLLESVREVGSEPAGLLRIMLPVGLPPHMLTPLLAVMRARYPKLSYRVRLSDNPVGGLLEDVDLAVHFGEQSPEGPWTSREVARVRMWLLASADYLKQHGTPTCIEDLHRHVLMAWERPGQDGRVWRTLQGGSFTVSPTLLIGDIHLLRQAAISGQGIVLLPDAMLPDPGLDPGLLVPVLPDIVGQHVAVRIVVPNALAEIPRIKAVLDLFRMFIDGL